MRLTAKLLLARLNKSDSQRVLEICHRAHIAEGKVRTTTWAGTHPRSMSQRRSPIARVNSLVFSRHLSLVTRHFDYRSDVINGILKCV